MNILITGANGFIGKNLVTELESKVNDNIFKYDRNTNSNYLEKYCREADFVFHLAGVNRPQKKSEFIKDNVEFTNKLLNKLKKYNNTCPIMFSSSIQANLGNPYGKSKKAAEDLLFKYNEDTGIKVLVYRFPNVFGKWCKPNYNSVVATFCYNITRSLPINIDDENVTLDLVYIDDVIEQLLKSLEGKENKSGRFCIVPITYTKKLSEIVELIYSFKRNRKKLVVPNMSDTFTKKLYSTFTSYIPEDQFSYNIKMNIDKRGSFTEFIKGFYIGQVSVNISKPGTIKGNHWHHSKIEKFLVVKGKGVIRFRKIGSDKITKYHVSGDKVQVVDVPPGYTHNIENIGDTDMVTIIWANEVYDPKKSDTYVLDV